VKVATDTELYGWGEGATQIWYMGETLQHLVALVELFESRLIGQDPLNINRCHEIMQRTSSGGAPGSRSAVAAVEMALFDLAGKAYRQPVYQLLGGCYRTEFELLTNLYEKSPSDMANACSHYVAEGFRGLKVKVGDVLLAKGWSVMNFNLEMEKLLAALEVVPKDVYVDADANQGWKSAKLAITAANGPLKGHTNLALEQPLGYSDIAGHAMVRKSIDLPVILDESILSPEACLQAIKSDAVDRICLKINRVGGLAPARKVIDIAEAAAVGISIDTNPYTKLGDTALCHLAATVRDAYPLAAEGHTWFQADDQQFVHGGLQIADGRARISDAAGLGAEVDVDALAAYSARVG
jgi:L-alanine-DL-glutamate epimerase-like enolase superfamily enzyme